MIVINTDRGLIEVESWEDIKSRPGFNGSLELAEGRKLAAIIGRYQFAYEIPCGLSECHRDHKKGYIAVTSDGAETNIGHKCGFNYFGVSFKELSAKFNRDIEEKQNRERLWNFSFNLDDLKSRVDELREQERGANWVHKLSRPLIELTDEVPHTIVRQMGNLVKTKSTAVTTTRVATEKETETAEAMRGVILRRPWHVEETVAEVAGIDALYPENDLRQLLVIELEVPIDKFEAEDIDSMTFDRLRYWAKWTGTVEGIIERAISAIERGRALLRQSNLSPLVRILERGKDQDLRVPNSALSREA